MSLPQSLSHVYVRYLWKHFRISLIRLSCLTTICTARIEIRYPLLLYDLASIYSDSNLCLNHCLGTSCKYVGICTVFKFLLHYHGLRCHSYVRERGCHQSCSIEETERRGSWHLSIARRLPTPGGRSLSRNSEPSKLMFILCPRNLPAVRRNLQ